MSPCDRSVPASFLGALTPNSILGHRSCICQHGRSTDYFGGFSFDRFVLAAEFPSVDLADEIGVNVVLLNDVLDRASVIEVLGEGRDRNPHSPADGGPAALPQRDLNGVVE